MSLTDLGMLGALLIAVPFILRFPFTGIIGWYIISYLNPHRFAHGFASSMPFGAIFAGTTLVAWLFSREPKLPPLNAVTILLVLFTVHFSITTWFAYVPNAALEEWDRTVKMTVMSLVAASMMTSRARLQAMVWVIVLSIGFHGLKGGVFTLMSGGGHIVMGPPKSFFGDRNFLAVQMACIIPLMRYLYTYTEHRYVRYGLLGGIALVTFAVLGTQSRAGFLCLAVLGVYIIWKSRHRMQLTIAATLLSVVAVGFMPTEWVSRMETLRNVEEDTSFQGRLESWNAAIQTAIERPLLGGGFEAYRSPRTATPRAWHSMWFQVLGEQGLLGFFLWLSVGISTWLLLAMASRRSRHNASAAWLRDLTAMTQVSLATFAVGGSSLDVAYIDLIFNFSVIAIGCAAISQVDTAPRPQAPGARSAQERQPNRSRLLTPRQDV